MSELTVQQIRSFRLRSHHLDAAYQLSDIPAAVGACGMQNTPPGAWATALHSRIPDCSLARMEQLLYQEKTLLQAWSLRGAPVVFPAVESDAFLSALIPEGEEPWIYTKGILLALEFLQMSFEELFTLLNQVMPQLDQAVIVSKTALDQTLADWMMPLLPADKRDLWNQPSMYGHPEVQTVGGAVVSFLLRPCSFSGLVVFGERNGISPSFTSYRTWTGCPPPDTDDASHKLVRKFLRCYGPATVDSFVDWLGCSGRQGRRLWQTISEETETINIFGKKACILSEDREQLFSSPSFERELLLLGGHDPYLDQRDRHVLQPDKSLHSHIWKTVANPGAILCRGEVIGVWTSRKKGSGLELKMTLWNGFQDKQKLIALGEEYAAFRQQKLVTLEVWNKDSSKY